MLLFLGFVFVSADILGSTLGPIPSFVVLAVLYGVGYAWTGGGSPIENIFPKSMREAAARKKKQ